MTKLLLFNITPDKATAIKLFAGEATEVISVAEEDFSLPLGKLLGMEEFAKARRDTNQSPFKEEMLIFAECDPKEAGAMLRSFREAGLPDIALKAVATPSNVGWSCISLKEELEQEAEAFRQMHQSR